MCKRASAERAVHKGIWICHLSLSNAFSNLSTAADRKQSLLISEPLNSREFRLELCFPGLKKIYSLETNSILHFIICSCFPLLKKVLRTGARLIFLQKMLFYSEVPRDPRRVSPSGHAASSLSLQGDPDSGVLPSTLGSKT